MVVSKRVAVPPVSSRFWFPGSRYVPERDLFVRRVYGTTVLAPPEGPYVLQGPATDVEANKLRHSAAAFRRMLDGLLQRTQGVQYTLNTPTDLKVLATGTPDGFVHVNAGACYVRGTQATPQGMYHLFNDATLDINVLGPNPAHATLDRIDLVVARVQDSFYSGATDLPTIEMVTGTPAGSPVAPAQPANTLLLAQLSIIHATATIPQGVITDKRVPAGLTPVLLFTTAGATPYPYDFQNIPPGFRDLEVRLKIRDNTAVNGFNNTQFRFNADAGANYAAEQIVANATTIGAVQLQNPAAPATAGSVAPCAGGGLTNASQFCQSIVRIHNYSDTNNEKSARGDFSGETGTHVTGSIYVYVYSMQWQAAAAINRLQIYSDGAGVTAWNANSSVEVWGIP